MRINWRNASRKKVEGRFRELATKEALGTIVPKEQKQLEMLSRIREKFDSPLPRETAARKRNTQRFNRVMKVLDSYKRKLSWANRLKGKAKREYLERIGINLGTQVDSWNIGKEAKASTTSRPKKN